jgi:hypothetical protein
MTVLTPLLNALVILRNVVGIIGLLFGAYLVLSALPELPRYVRIKMM